MNYISHSPRNWCESVVKETSCFKLNRYALFSCYPDHYELNLIYPKSTTKLYEILRFKDVPVTAVMFDIFIKFGIFLRYSTPSYLRYRT